MAKNKKIVLGSGLLYALEFTGDFEATWNDVLAGCQGILAAM